MNAREIQTLALMKIEGKTMSKREQFAVAALQGLLSNSTVSATPEILVEVAVEYADLLIAELNDDTEAAEEAEEEKAGAVQEDEEDDFDCPGCAARREGRDGASLDEVLQFMFKKAMQ
jgi:hypothetical protein